MKINTIKMMKKLLVPILLLLVSSVNAQLNNSWIDYSKTYYKFKVGKDTLCRIPASTLTAAGIGSANAADFQLWRNGQQVRIYTSIPTGQFGATDFIEFWGEMNDGKPDNTLYRQPSFQVADRYSLETDTASYFLTFNNTGGNLRYTAAVNTSPSAATPDAYFMRKVDMYYRSQINRGKAEILVEYVYSASYDVGEGWASYDANPCCDFTQEVFNLNVYPAGPPNSLSLRVGASGNAPNARNLLLKMFSDTLYNSPMPFFGTASVNLTGLPLTLFQNTSYVPIYVNNNSSVTNDRLVVNYIGLTYPATFNFNNQKDFYFELQPSATGNYLVIDNVNYGAVAPILYDMTTGSRYIGDIVSTPGKVKFVLPASSEPVRKCMLMNQEPANVNVIGSLKQRSFVNFGNAATQGDYIIISHPALYNDGSGNNYVDQYRQYRSSAAGGSYNAKVYDIDELTDQFAFGIKGHPTAVRDFMRYAKQQFAVAPKYVLLIGRGMNYMEQLAHETSPLSDKLNFIPTFGWPASDVLMVSEPGTVLPIAPVGRLGVVNPGEISNYLDKVKQYEQVQQTPGSTIESKAWMKNYIHVAGGKDSAENAEFKAYMDGYRDIAIDSLMGAHVETFTKTSTGAVQQANSQRIEQLFDQGIGFIGYFGHSSASTFEFNLSDPQIYTNTGKYPFFNVSGCSAGNFFIYDPLRLTGNLSLSEKYVLANQRGSIGFLADTHFGIPPFLNFYNTDLYTNSCKDMYGNTVGNQIKQGMQSLGGLNPNVDYYTRIHLEEVTLQGDPAIRINAAAKPDYVIEDQQVKISPNIISVADNDFDVNIKINNIGKATNDSIWISVKRKLPDGTIHVLVDSLIRATRYEDTLDLKNILINPVTDKGLNQLIITLDYTNRVDELFETNNTLTKDFYVFEDELRPVFPYNFSIINQQNITYTASTANPLGGQRDYVMEVDTTELFNSAYKKTYNKSGVGGIVEFTPNNITFSDSTVYYWRVAVVPSGTAAYIWNSYSFVYLPNSSTGFNQSHYYQHLKDNYTNISLGTDRKFSFETLPRILTIRTGLYPYFDYDKINVNLDFDQLELYGCVYNSLQFYVFDTTTLKPWDNRNTTFTGSTPTHGMYGSYPVCQNSALTDTTRRFFEYPYSSPAYRKSAMDFIDAIPNGMYVAITNIGNSLANPDFINKWKDDTLTLGSGNSLYHKLKSIGFTQIDSFYHHLPFLYFFKKGSTTYAPTTVIGPKDSSYIDQPFALNTTYTNGSIESPVYGPAQKWTALHWRGSVNDPLPFADTTSVQVWGIKGDGTIDLLATVAPAQDTSLAFINAAIYPNIKLKLLSSDAVHNTPYQLSYLRVNADYVPEGAVASNLLYKMRDSVEQGDKIDFALAFKNISQTKFDSMMKIKLTITDKNNNTTAVTVPKGKILIAGDTLSVGYTIDTRNFPGNNTLFVEFNPNNDQQEQYHFNNVLYKGFYVKEDKYNPLLDVTFDGVHILNKDIVSSKPAILVKLKDESRFLELKDTSSLKVQVRYPDQTLHNYIFGDTMHFNPANLSTGENTASIDLRPNFPEDGEYELIVTGKDAVGNTAGNLDFHVIFNVINKPSISNLLNYPNPFTTSTAFVFTVTGSEVPQNIRIQILTITGKIVREITKDELGPIHIGNNITEFKWDGTDMYGAKLANGVYIYRVLTNLNGKRLDKFDGRNANGDVINSGVSGTDKYFNKGYGKMYLMR